MIDRMKHLLPNDRMKIFISDAFYEDAEAVLTLLYQPLIKMQGVALFQALWKEASIQSSQTSLSHHQMMSLLNITLDDFYESRKSLEAIGLLKTYKEDGTYTTFYYHLQRPFSAKGFFEDPMLSVLLEHHVGRDSFQRLRKSLVRNITIPSNVDEETKAFDEVFTTVQRSANMKEQKRVKEDPLTTQTSLPIDWLQKMLKQQNINPNLILTRANTDYIEKMIKIYDVDFLELEKAIIWAVSEDQTFDKKEFQDMCKDIFYKKHGSVPPRLYSKTEHESTEKSKSNEGTKGDEKSLSKMDKLINHFETITHRELLEDVSPSGRASYKEVDMLTNMMEEHGLTQPVMNVLVDYVLRKNGNKLAKNYLETIAAHWGREGIKTAKEAINLAKREHKLYQTWQQKKVQKKEYPSKKKEVLPKWYQEQKSQTKSTKTFNEQQNADLTKEQEELEAFFKRFSKKDL